MAKAFQTNAFQTTYPGPLYAFQGQDRFIGIVNDSLKVRDFLIVEVGPIMLEYARTSAVIFEVTIFDPTENPPILFDPTSVQLNLLRPDETSEVSLGAMTRISTGFYRYTWQSDANDTLGVYQVNVKVTSGGNVKQTVSTVAFKLVPITS